MNAWPKEREPELVALRESGVSIVRIAELAGVSEQVASYHLKEVEPITRMVDLLPNYPEEMLRIPDGPCALTADWHAPYFSIKWTRRLLAVCLELDIHTLAIVGDLTDMAWLSRYLRKETRGGLQNDMEITLALLHILLGFFQDVYWSYGNHEDRLPNMLRGHDLLPVLGALARRAECGELHVSDMRTMLLGDEWQLEHPKTYSRDAAKVAAQVAAIVHRNVACGHGHHIGFKHDVSGKYIGIDLGAMLDEDKQEYLFKSGVTTMPVFNPGFWVYHNGKVRPFEDALINWEEWGTE